MNGDEVRPCWAPIALSSLPALSELPPLGVPPLGVPPLGVPPLGVPPLGVPPLGDLPPRSDADPLGGVSPTRR